jgi:hypothetical protein
LQPGLALGPADNGNTLSLEVQRDRREMGLRDLRLIEAIYASAATGRTLMLNPDGTMAERASAYM